MKLILIRGLPGSGKSTLALTLMFAPAMGVTTHREADQYFMEDGEYNFDATQLHHAHKWCQDMTSLDLSAGCNVIVSNTFTTAKELKPYFEIAHGFGIIPQVITCQGQFGSIHGVPEETMTSMRRRFAHDISHVYKIQNG